MYNSTRLKLLHVNDKSLQMMVIIVHSFSFITQSTRSTVLVQCDLLMENGEPQTSMLLFRKNKKKHRKMFGNIAVFAIPLASRAEGSGLQPPSYFSRCTFLQTIL